MARGMLDERVEKDRFVRHGKIVVAELTVTVLRNRAEFCPKGLVGFAGCRAAIGDQAGKLSCGIESSARTFDPVDMVVQHVPRGLAHPTAG